MMAEAVKDLLDGATAPETAPAVDAPATPTPGPNTSEATPATPPATDAQPDVTPASEADQSTATDDSATRKKVIQPLAPGNEPTQPDLNELLAKEGITDFDKDQQHAPAPAFNQNTPMPQTQANQPHPPGHVISPTPTQPTDSQGQPIDPNSISL